MTNYNNIRIEKFEKVSQDQGAWISRIFPDDNLKERRASNLLKARYVVVLKVEDEIAGVLFVRNILMIPNATWIVGEKFQGMGFGSKLIEASQKDLLFITAITRNEISARLARKAGFTHLPPAIWVWMNWTKLWKK
jgi:RimJ/RimL family protein N-acetyltransferase